MKPIPVSTGNVVIDEFFREFDAKLADEDSRIPAAQKAALRKLRPEFLKIAQEDPERFILDLLSAASSIVKIGNG